MYKYQNDAAALCVVLASIERNRFLKADELEEGGNGSEPEYGVSSVFNFFRFFLTEVRGH